MKPPSFKYVAPDSLSQALDIMADNGDDAKLLAGGQSLIPAMNFRLVQPTLIVDLNRLTGLDYVSREPNGDLRIGSLTRQRTLERNGLVQEAAPLLHETMPHIAHLQIRSRGTIGGSLVHADPAAELPVIMVALNGRFKLKQKNSERWVSADDFFQGIFATALEPDELMVEIVIPAMVRRTGTAFVEFARRKGDYALLGVAVLMTLDESGNCLEARLVYLNAGERPIKASQSESVLIGQKPTPALFEEAATIGAEVEINPTGDIHASQAYLRHLGKILTVRALSKAHQRAIETM
jgi:CO/xanthine dehydrogenase FAD-binding subunit